MGICHFPPKDRFAIVIPVYNHEQMAPEVIAGAVKIGFPVFVTDDGSTDSTYDRIKNIKGVYFLRHECNQGKGAALLTAFAAASRAADWAVSLDADGQHDPAEIGHLISAVSGMERAIIIGRRKEMSGKDVPITSRLGREFSNFWVWCAGGPLLHDTQSGFRIYPLPESLHLGVRSRRFQFEVEILVKAGWKGLPVREVPISVTYSPGSGRISHFRPFIDFVRNSNTFTRLIFQRLLCSASLRKKIK